MKTDERQFHFELYSPHIRKDEKHYKSGISDDIYLYMKDDEDFTETTGMYDGFTVYISIAREDENET